jgi:Zn-finger nucleic acid-binding protein
MATCPRCPGSPLQHTLLVGNLPAHGCAQCDGVLLNLVTYRHWRESEAIRISVAATGPASTVTEDPHEAIACPKCRALMTKYRISAEVPNRLDYCAHCEELWFDAGEWDFVENIARSGHLAEVFGQPWQRRIRRKISEQMEAQRLQQLLGSDYPKFAEFRAWFQAHPERSRLLAMLFRKRA